MDLLNVTNTAQIHEFYKKVKERKYLFLNQGFKLCDL